MIYMPATQIQRYTRSNQTDIRPAQANEVHTRHSLKMRMAVVSILMLICLGVGALFHSFTGDNEVQAASLSVHEQIIVMPGDTLWSISRQRVQSNEDIRIYIKKLKKLNDMTSSNLQAGQLLLLP